MLLERRSVLARTKRAKEGDRAETLAASQVPDEDLSEIAHDDCNMITPLDLYCDLLAANRDPSGACFQIQLPADAATLQSKEHNE
jgi:hypothetical protein